MERTQEQIIQGQVAEKAKYAVSVAAASGNVAKDAFVSTLSGAKTIGDKAVASIVKRTVVDGEILNGATKAEAALTARKFAGHSLRSGLATSAAANDAPGHAIQRQLRHKRFDTTQGYIRSGELFKKNAAGMAGL